MVKKVIRACQIGYLIQAVINNILPLFFVLISTGYSVTLTELSGLVLFNFICQLVVDIASIKIVGVLGTKRAVLMAHLLSAIGIAGYSFLPYVIGNVYLGFLICIGISAVGSGLIEVLISPIVDKIGDENKSGNMSLLHSFYCLGQAATVLVTTLLIRLAGDYWRIVPLFWVILPIYNYLAFVRLDVPEIENGKREKTISLKNAEYIILLIMMFCAGASELAMSQWASAFSESVLGISKILGDLVGPCMFAVLMGAGRLLYAVFSKQIDEYRAMIGCAVLCVACYITAAFSTLPILSLIACAVCGLSVSIMWPVTYSMASDRFPLGGALLFGTLAMMGDLGCSVGPSLLGTVADASSFSVGFMVSALFPFVMVIASVILKYKKAEVKV